MSTAIRVDNLWKAFRIGAGPRGAPTFRETVMATVAAPFRRARSVLRGGAARDRDETFWALSGVSCEINEGDVVGVIGRNGAGKSTLLKVLCQITPPTRGEVRIRGRVGALLEVGTGFHPELSGRDNIFLNGALLGMSRAEIRRKLDAIIGFAEVDRFLDTPVKHYSSGMYMRLAFAVAAHLEPEVLIVDEVLSVGDAQFQKKCLGRMGEVAKTGRTVLFVSHQMNAVEKICQKAMLLRAGQVAEFSTDVASVIRTHLSAGLDDPTGAETVCPPRFENPYFAPHRIRICDGAGATHQMPVPNSADLWFEVEGTVARLDSGLVLGYAIFTADGQLLYWSYTTDTPEADWPPVRTGRNVLRGRIPSRLFNEGTYRVEFVSGLHFRQWLCEPGGDVPAVTLAIQGGLSDSPMYTTHRPGVLAPIIPWVPA